MNKLVIDKALREAVRQMVLKELHEKYDLPPKVVVDKAVAGVIKSLRRLRTAYDKSHPRA